MVTPLYYFEISLWLNDPKNFQKALSASKYTNFEGGARAEKNAIFWSKPSET